LIVGRYTKTIRTEARKKSGHSVEKLGEEKLGSVRFNITKKYNYFIFTFV